MLFLANESHIVFQKEFQLFLMQHGKHTNTNNDDAIPSTDMQLQFSNYSTASGGSSLSTPTATDTITTLNINNNNNNNNNIIPFSDQITRFVRQHFMDP